MTQEARLRSYGKELVSPVSFLSSAVGAGIGQWRDRPPEWKQGGEGFGLRFGSSFAQHVTGSTLMFGLSSALHEDNRYFQSGDAAFGSRLRYALESTVLARHDDGSRHVSFSRIGALAGAAMISRAWQPAHYRTVRGGVASFGVSMAVTAGFQVAREFLPALLHAR